MSAASLHRRLKRSADEDKSASQAARTAFSLERRNRKRGTPATRGEATPNRRGATSIVASGRPTDRRGAGNRTVSGAPLPGSDSAAGQGRKRFVPAGREDAVLDVDVFAVGRLSVRRTHVGAKAAKALEHGPVDCHIAPLQALAVNAQRTQHRTEIPLAHAMPATRRSHAGSVVPRPHSRSSRRRQTPAPVSGKNSRARARDTGGRSADRRP